MDIDEIKVLLIARESAPEETADNWAEWVARPCVKYPLAPREARAILEIFGQLRAYGINLYRYLVEYLVRLQFFKNYWGQNEHNKL